VKNDKTLIFLADLVHNYDSKGPHIIPVNIGYVASYAKKLYGDRVEIRLFKYPMDLINAFKQQLPDIIGLSCYTWNTDINSKIISRVKSLRGDIITVFGGPDYPVGKNEGLSYFKQRPDLDFYIIHQGESGFANLLERYFLCDSLEEMKKDSISNCLFYNEKTGGNVVSGGYNPIQDLDKIPSPFLTGILDEFFLKELTPLIETNRGCPYSCTYCAWGKSNLGKVMCFDLERVKQEIEYIAHKIGNIQLLMIGDANFGLMKRDVEIAEFVVSMGRKYGFPRELIVSWAKTGADRLIKMAEILSETMGLAAAFGSFQSTDPMVMRNIKRTNLSWDEFKKIQQYFHLKGISTSSDLILGLPGETSASHLKGLKDLFDNNTTSMFCYNLRMIGGSEFNTDENRERYGIKTKFRLVDGGYGKYDNILSIESEEIVLHTNTITMEETLRFRPIHFLTQFMWNYKYYGELIYFAKELGINLMDIVVEVLERKESAPQSVQDMFEEFRKDTYGEWFDTERELVDYYSIPENFEYISSGGFGKMNFKYMYKVILECKEDFDAYLFAIAEQILAERHLLNNEIKEQLNNLLKYTRNSFIDLQKLLQGRSEAGRMDEFEYDILGWKHQRYLKPFSDFRKGRIGLKFTVPNERITALKKRYERYKTANINQTLRKMVEDMNEKDLFHEIEYK